MVLGRMSGSFVEVAAGIRFSTFPEESTDWFRV